MLHHACASGNQRWLFGSALVLLRGLEALVELERAQLREQLQGQGRLLAQPRQAQARQQRPPQELR